MRLLNPQALERSPVVANSVMNRQRRLSSGNGYAREPRLGIHAWLRTRAGAAAWADLCCGEGHALIKAAAALIQMGATTDLRPEGIDLAGLLRTTPSPPCCHCANKASKRGRPIDRTR